MARALLLILLWSALSCDAGALLGPDAPQGIDGLALRGPVCPVETSGEDCAPRPHQASIEVRDVAGRRVTQVRSDADGRFRVGLEPGRYTLVPEEGDPFPTAVVREVEVAPWSWVAVTLHFDTGIRE